MPKRGANLKISLRFHLVSCNLRNFGRCLSQFREIQLFTRNLTDFVHYNKSFVQIKILIKETDYANGIKQRLFAVVAKKTQNIFLTMAVAI